ncbi:MAG TPA: SpvB/TcaC N-terminal domain-containing protein [Candidatus Kapabacteria bacterium]|nr:SpvB/TcaC N-terminal domain-containing protein [Candidatus Kapabacteria bacterium]
MPNNEQQESSRQGQNGAAAPGSPSPKSPSQSQTQPKAQSQSDGSQQNGAFSISPLSLPKGGGAIRGIGEKFGVNAATGTGSITVPLATTPGRSEFGPQLVLSYDSGSGNGPFGFGWSLGLPAITRKTDKGLPRYDDGGESDIFVLSGAEDLVPVLDVSGARIRMTRTVHGVAYTIAIYRPRIEGLFSRIERWTRNADGISHWRSITRDNITTLYGYDAGSTITDPDNPRNIFAYRICRSFDDKGNVIRYEYAAEDGAGVDRTHAHEANRTNASRAAQNYLKRIRYGNGTPWFADWSGGGSEPALPTDWHFEVVLDYGDHNTLVPVPTPDTAWPVRPDPFSTFRSGFDVRTYRRCRRVLMFHHFAGEANVGTNCLVQSTDFTYSDDAAPTDPTNPIYTFLSSVVHTGYRRDGMGGYIRRTMPPTEFEYSKPVIQPDVLTLDPEGFENLPEGMDGSRYQWVDLDGEGLSGILTDMGGEWGYHRNLSPVNLVPGPGGDPVMRAKFGPLEEVSPLPSRSELGAQVRLMDLAGDGQLDVVLLEDPAPGFFERTADDAWAPLQRFASLPAINWSDPNLRLIDVTGDGLADALITEEGFFTWHQSLGEDGYAEAMMVRTPWDEERGPTVAFADSTGAVFLADMTGDGLTDVVRVRNGEICYWPNRGYGRFGAKVSMDNAPRFTDDERFDAHRVRLTDIDGSGSTDVLYLGDDGVHVCFNRSGNSWAAPALLAIFPSADMLSSVQVCDLLGNGTACLVWSTSLPANTGRPLRYIDLMGGSKPHLMTTSRNNLGAETRVHYAPSTKFYLQDRMAGTPWITRLPHLVHVVERTETFDFIGRSRFVTRYAYHHGYFDGVEREFRGFGMVEQWDTEEHRDDMAFPEAEATNWDSISWVPPVHTKTWFHTGAFVEAGTVSLQYENEYWAEPSTRGTSPAAVAAREALLLPDTVMPAGLTAQETREAYRALKGSTLRIEVFADDGTAQAEHPYTVTEQNFTVMYVQAFGPNQHAVFHVHPREALHYHYERNPADPRITHDITLATDNFGNVLQSVSVGYGRRAGYTAPEPLLTSAFQSMLAHDQTQLHIGAVEHTFTTPLNQPWDATSFDVFRAPVECETIAAELTGVTPAGGRFTFSEMAANWTTLWSGAHDIAYEEVSTPDIEGVGTPTGLARRITSHSRTLYRRDDLSGLLPLGTLEAHAIAGEAYQLALTPGLINRIFGTRVNSTILGEGGYVQLPGSSDWWIPTGRVYLSPGDTDTPAQELTQAQAHFYAVRRAIDPFGSITRVRSDAYNLLPLEVTDPLGNTTMADNDYRVMHPFRLTDPNGNFSESAFDCLGMVVGTALYGKAGEGDSLAGFDPDLSDAAILAIRANPLSSPGTLLGNATSRIVYDAFGYYRTRNLSVPEPAMVYVLAREIHVSDVPPGGSTPYHHMLAYSDGFGREAQHKMQAEPGPVPGLGGTISPRWVGSGWTIFNNKGSAVRKFEPFFTATHEFEFNRQVGVSSILFHDATDRVVAMLHPDNSFEKTVFDAWRQETWDRNDTASISDPRADADVGDFFTRLLGTAPGAFTSWYDLRVGGTYGSTANERLANQDAAIKVAAHAATPAVMYFDSLGRTCLSIADNGVVGGVDQRYATRTAMDTENKPLAVIDPLGRHVAEFCYREPSGGSGFVYVAGYDVVRRPLYQNGMDGGERRILQNVHGDVIRTWDARGFTLRILYDALRRPTHRYVDRAGFGETLAERMVYGERHSDATRNLKGHLFRHYDSGGVASHDRHDFKGNLLESGRQLAVQTPSMTSPPDVDRAPDWSAIATITDSPTLDITALDAAAAPMLDANDAFIASSRFDALNRSVQMVTPHLAGGNPNVIQPRYNEANLLEAIDVWVRQGSAPGGLLAPATADINAVTDVNYNARGQRIDITLGNGSVTSYAYDPDVFRLATLTTTRPHPNPNARTVQALSYTYDPAGNVTRIRDDADIQNVVYFRNQRVDPTADYTYDPLYRLTAATGREHLGLTGMSLNAAQQTINDDGFRTGQINPGDGNAVGTYTERYTYDPIGNLLTMVHQVASGGWTRRYAYNETSCITPAETSNRLSATSMPGDPVGGPYSATYRYDAHGNITRMPHLPEMTWDEYDRLQSTTRQVVGSGMPETTYYNYDSTGNRLRKITYRQAPAATTPTRKCERIYLGDFEIYREYDASGTTVMLERETLHTMFDRRRILMVETRTVDVLGTDPAPAQMVRYQYANLVDSAVLELDENADVISYEEYFPYGSTSYQAVRASTDTPKRYRYTGKERDEENDLFYHGARYYIPWLGRWCSVDPLGLSGSTNLYAYANCRPINASDPDGRQPLEIHPTQPPAEFTNAVQNLAARYGPNAQIQATYNTPANGQPYGEIRVTAPDGTVTSIAYQNGRFAGQMELPAQTLDGMTFRGGRTYFSWDGQHDVNQLPNAQAAENYLAGGAQTQAPPEGQAQQNGNANAQPEQAAPEQQNQNPNPNQNQNQNPNHNLDLTPQSLRNAIPGLNQRRAEQLAPILNNAMREFNINTPERRNMFLAQVAHESGSLRFFRELGNDRYFERYNNRRDLGNTHPGDGPRYRGRGAIQITGRRNYEQAGRALGLDLVNHPELLEQPENALRSAAWWWANHGLNQMVDQHPGDVRRTTRRINGGYNGLQDRIQRYQRVQRALGH